MSKEILYMAPVRGITDLIYRNTFAKHFGGIDIAMTPFLTTVKGDQIKPSQVEEFIPANNSIPIIPQIIGKSAANFIVLAKTLSDLGNEHVNWNLGCPHPTMTRKKCGSGLLPHADLIDSFLDKVCAAIPNKLSVKVRLGLTENTDLEDLIQVFNRYPLTEVTIHPRTGKQMYKGSVDTDMFEHYMKQFEHPVIYNGDIYTLENFTLLKQRFPSINKWMLGRGLFANPMLALAIENNQVTPENEKLRRIMEFHEELLACYKARLSGDAHLIQKMVGHWEYLQHSIPDGKKLFKKLKKAKSVASFRQLLVGSS